jgi:predicted glycoside hydrolase/deacetylase ChbG (UPF0249 family)
MNVMVVSDDAGATAAMTDRILSAWQAGWLDGFSIITNGAACDRLSAALRADPARPARLAAHLNLSEGKPDAPLADVGMLVNDGGVLRHSFGSLLWTWLRSGPAVRRALVQQVETEWRAQIARAKALCAPRPITAVDGHIHVHMLPFLFPIALRLAEEAGVPEIRVSREPSFVSARAGDLGARVLPNVIKHVLLRALSVPAERRLRGSRVSSGAIVGVLYSGLMSEAAAAAGIRAARRSGAPAVEVVFHVGRAAEAETGRWAHTPGAIPFFVSPLRDAEYDAVRKLRTAHV